MVTAPPRLHLDEAVIDADLVRRLLAAQFPAWTRLPLALVPSSGTDNVMYRLGTQMVVRLPRLERAAEQVETEHLWLPRLGPRLPLATPRPLAKGAAGEGYPWTWSIYGWLDGEPVRLEAIADHCAAARDLAAFIAALQAIDPTGGPPPRPGNAYRGQPLGVRDRITRAAIARLTGEIDAAAATAVWDAAMAVQPRTAPPVWLHGDLLPGNLLVADGRLTAVIDFGCMAAGDPACDLMPAWSLFAGELRQAFRAALAADDDAWALGRGWSLHQGLMALPYYRDTNPAFAARCKQAIESVIADFRSDR